MAGETSSGEQRPEIRPESGVLAPLPRPAASVERRESTVNQLQDDPSKPEFRVVAQGSTKRGIRLEHAFWQASKKIAHDRGMSIAGFFDSVADSDANATNLASAIRVACVTWLESRAAELEAVTSITSITSVLAAIPAPAIVIGADRRILASNRAFESFLRRQLGIARGVLFGTVRFTPDLAMQDILAKLGKEESRNIMTGFSLSVGERKMRGQINLARAPLSERDSVIGFIVL